MTATDQTYKNAMAKDVLVDYDAIADALLRLCYDRSKPLHHPAAPEGPPPCAEGVGIATAPEGRGGGVE